MLLTCYVLCLELKLYFVVFICLFYCTVRIEYFYFDGLTLFSSMKFIFELCGIAIIDKTRFHTNENGFYLL